MIYKNTTKLDAFERLLTIMDDLREKCPWDKKQTFESLRNLTIEETYELADAILEKNPADFKELLNLVLQGTNTNNYLNTRLVNLSKIAEKLDSAIVKEYGDKFH